MPKLGWVWVLLAFFFVLQGAVATWIIRSVDRLRRTSHRIANHLQAMSVQLEARGVIKLPQADVESRDDDGSPVRK